MDDINIAIKKLDQYACHKLTSARYLHSVLVAKESIVLAKKFGVDHKKAYLAGIAHDIAREFSNTRILKLADKYQLEIDNLQRLYPASLLHGPIASKILEYDFSIKDSQILNAVFYHTTGSPNMERFEKIICVADYIEPSRNFTGVGKLRNLAYKDLDLCLYHCLLGTYYHLKKQGLNPHKLLVDTITQLKQ
ncbi:bis(5'-nucleosyl)-tetraphosphatase (symmetrical) YqeK [Proteinivorax tanatarense]|uniref:Bis(5'-nucleosyl)-tetraphosphatase (Symmetrical) YqeK n=1 Tax=Proteinivorax tanatarense TaxID=1260629 RepID=A0AAU7VIE3_9FIRM